MAIKYNTVKCPQCEANLEIEEGRDKIFCSYCGAQVVATNENEYIYRHIDEAEVKQAETDRLIKLKQMEIAEKRRESEEKNRAFKIKMSIILGLIAMVFMGIGFSGEHSIGFAFPGLIAIYALMFMWISGNNKEDADDDGIKVKVPSIVNDYESKNYQVIENAFQSAGFKNVRCIALNDLTTGLLKKPGMVATITINGNEVTSGGKRYNPEVAVIISYHSFAR